MSEQLKAYIESRLDQQWAAALDWVKACHIRSGDAIWRLAEMVNAQDVDALRNLNDKTLRQVCNLTSLILIELSKRAFEQIEEEAEPDANQ